MTKNVFYFVLKALFVLKTFKFCIGPLVIQKKKGLTRKKRMISKSVTSQPGKQAITIHILPNFSESKGNQKIKFDQLIKYNKKNIFL